MKSLQFVVIPFVWVFNFFFGPTVSQTSVPPRLPRGLTPKAPSTTPAGSYSSSSNAADAGPVPPGPFPALLARRGVCVVGHCPSFCGFPFTRVFRCPCPPEKPLCPSPGCGGTCGLPRAEGAAHPGPSSRPPTKHLRLAEPGGSGRSRPVPGGAGWSRAEGKKLL